MKKEIRFIIIGFIVVMIPLGFIVKRSIAIDIQKEAIDLIHFGYTQKDKEKALEKINLAIRLAPRNYLFYVTKAEILESLGKHREAINEFYKIHEFKDNYAEGYVAIGMQYERLGYADSAIIFYNSAMDSYNYRIEKYANNKEKLYNARPNKAYVYDLLGDSNSSDLEFKKLKNDYPEYLEMIEKIESSDKE
jgi:tetratricopeptide (TPR) repeat protein